MAAVAREWPPLKVDEPPVARALFHLQVGVCGGLRGLRFDRCVVDTLSRSIALAGRNQPFSFKDQPTLDRVLGALQRSFFSTAHR